MVLKQEVNIPLALTIGLVSGLLLLVMTFGMQAWYESAEQGIMAEKLLDAPKSDYVQMKESQWNTVTAEQPGWANTAHTVVRIPVKRAMDLMVQNNGKLPSTQPATSQPAATQPTVSVDAGR